MKKMIVTLFFLLLPCSVFSMEKPPESCLVESGSSSDDLCGKEFYNLLPTGYYDRFAAAFLGEENNSTFQGLQEVQSPEVHNSNDQGKEIEKLKASLGEAFAWINDLVGRVANLEKNYNAEIEKNRQLAEKTTVLGAALFQLKQRTLIFQEYNFGCKRDDIKIKLLKLLSKKEKRGKKRKRGEVDEEDLEDSVLKELTERYLKSNQRGTEKVIINVETDSNKEKK